MHRRVQVFASGVLSVRNGRWADRTKPRPDPQRMPQALVIGWGSASIGVGSAISRRGLGPPLAFCRWAQANYHGRVAIVRVDESRTSQVCPGCFVCDKRHFTPPGASAASYKLFVCNICGLVTHRDRSAAQAMLVRLCGTIFAERNRGSLANFARRSAAGRPRGG